MPKNNVKIWTILLFLAPTDAYEIQLLIKNIKMILIVLAMTIPSKFLKITSYIIWVINLYFCYNQ